jgi:hypothetical protein
MKILVLAAIWPEPNSSAAGRRMMGLLELFIAQNWEVMYACTASESAHAFPLESLAISTTKITVNDSAFDVFLQGLAPDIILYDRFMVEEQFSWRVEQHCPQAMTMLETSDLHCLRKARQQALKEGREFTNNDLLGDAAYREIASIQRSDLSLIISKYEITLLQSVLKVEPTLLQYSPFVIDPTEVQQHKTSWPGYEQRNGFVSIGNFKHPPNWDSVQYLKTEIWPLIRRQLPSVELNIYGAYPPPKANQLDDPGEGFNIKGRAENAHDVIKKARICLAPLRFGAGLKGKLLDAMECGTPSVTTTIGSEAMHDGLPWGGAVCDEPQQFAQAAINLYQHEQDWYKCQRQGSAILEHCFFPAEHDESLLKRIEMIQQNLDAHRQQNFIGAMLKHHHLKSTKYMSLWIEEKNKGGV